MAAGATPSDISINLKANDQGLAAALQAAATHVSQFAQQSTSAVSAVRALGSEMDRAATAGRALTQAIRDAAQPISALSTALQSVTTRVRAMTTALSSATGPLNSLGTAFRNATTLARSMGQAVHGAATQVGAMGTASHSAATQVGAMGHAFHGAIAQVGALGTAVHGAAAQFAALPTSVHALNAQLHAMGPALHALNTQLHALSSVGPTLHSVSAASHSLATASAPLLNLRTAIAGLLPLLSASAFAGFGVGLLQTADQYGQLAAQIKLSTSSAEEAIRVQQQLYANSQATGSSYAANVAAYAKLGLSLREVGVASQTIVNLVDLVNKSLSINGSNAAMAASFQLQFAQAMGSGVLQGDEFRAMMESNGYFAGQLAKSLDTNIAGLRKMSSEGKLTTDVLLNAFEKLGDQINQDYAKLPTTASAAVQMIRNAWDQMVSGANTAASGTSRVSTALQNFAGVIDKNQSQLAAFLSQVIDLTARTVELTTRFGQFVAENIEMAQVIGTVTVSALALGRAFVFLRTLPVQIAAAHAAMTAFATSTAASVAAAGSAAWIGLGMAVGFTAIKITEAVQAYKSWQAAEAEHQASLARGKQYETELQARLEKISQQTGITVKSFAELRRAVDEGRLHYDSATKTWVAGAQKQTAAVEGVKKATGDALKEMQKQYQEYAKEIRRLQDEISGRQRSLAAELREMGRTGMSDAAAWQDQKREAEEYVQAARRAAQEARAAFAAGDTITAAARWKEAVQYADDARSAYRQLNTEVKEGDQVVVSKADALKTAMDGVKQAGELGVSILKEQQEVAAKAMDELVGQSGFADLTAGMSKAEKLWLESWRNMQTSAEQAVEEVSFKISAQQVQIESIEQAWLRSWANNRNYFVQVTDELRRRLDEATRPRTVTVYTAEVVRRATGGLINAFARGGRLPGYGGGDRVSALLEAGEFVMRKEAVRKFGAGFFESLNSLKLPDLSSLLPALPTPPLAAAGPASAADRMILELRLPGGDTVTASVSGQDAEKLRLMNRRVSNLGFRR